MTALAGIEITLVDDHAFGFGTFQSHNQKVVSNRNGLFMTHIRDRNEEYMRERITGSGRFNIVTRVQVINGEVVTPDWTVEANRLHEWYGKG